VHLLQLSRSGNRPNAQCRFCLCVEPYCIRRRHGGANRRGAKGLEIGGQFPRQALDASGEDLERCASHSKHRAGLQAQRCGKVLCFCPSILLHPIVWR
jgi:hypothetical protein